MASEKNLIVLDDAIRKLEAEKDKRDGSIMGGLICGLLQNVIHWLSSQPRVDAVEVVRCKDCVHMKNQFNARFCNIWCMYNGMGDEGFCNYGARKDNE